MGLIEKELEIVGLSDLFGLELDIPVYQRPYTWGVASANTLFTDTYKAFRDGSDEYRMGSVILHKNGGSYNIVDGQQRLTTLSILFYLMGLRDMGLLDREYSKLSEGRIYRNHLVLKQRLDDLEDKELENYKNYLLGSCTMVKIVTDNEQEAFQFFDSQNTRGKELAPHDLLKSFHLREMSGEEERLKVELINRWEDLDQEQIARLFKLYLYPVIRWFKGEEGLGYSSHKIDSFKGIRSSSVFNFAVYHKASNLYIEQLEASGAWELLSSQKLNQFQLTQPLVGGKRFFEYTIHYFKLLTEVERKVKDSLDNELLPQRGSGDMYIYQLFLAVLLFFGDRFGIKELRPREIKFFYRWAYTLRLKMYAVYAETINKYALGLHEVANKGYNIFRILSEMNGPEEIYLISLDSLGDLASNARNNYPKIVDELGGTQDE